MKHKKTNYFKSKKLNKSVKNLIKFWDFIWNDDSVLSWFLNIIFAIIIIKFLVYPGLGFLLSTHYPIVAVVSGSMEHAYAPLHDSYNNLILNNDGKVIYDFCNKLEYRDKKLLNLRDFQNFDSFWESCGDFYENRDIKKDNFLNFSFKNGFNTGDIMILYGTKPKDLKIGDIIVYSSSAKNDPIIHRIIKKWKVDGKYHFTTKGDHNSDINKYVSESDIIEDRVIAKAIIRVPYLGWVKIGAFKIITKIVQLF